MNSSKVQYIHVFLVASIALFSLGIFVEPNKSTYEKIVKAAALLKEPITKSKALTQKTVPANTHIGIELKYPFIEYKRPVQKQEKSKNDHAIYLMFFVISPISLVNISANLLAKDSFTSCSMDIVYCEKFSQMYRKIILGISA